MPTSTPQAAMNWAAAIKSRVPENVVKLYHPDGFLWGTLSPVMRHGHQAIHDYFMKFLKWEDLTCEIIDGTERIHNDFAFYSGHYEFSWKVDNHDIKVPARFSFVYKKEDDQWLIIEHHSSLYPELPFVADKYIQK